MPKETLTKVRDILEDLGSLCCEDLGELLTLIEFGHAQVLMEIEHRETSIDRPRDHLRLVQEIED